MNLNNIKTTLNNKLGLTGLYLQKHSPEILLGAGIIGVVVAAVMASKATLKVSAVMEEHDHKMMDITEEAAEHPDQYYDHTEMKDKAVVYVQTGVEMAKLYAPAIGVGVLSITAILASHGVMANRQASLVAAYGLLAKGYEAYRQRVREELGEEKELQFHLGLREEKYSETVIDPEDGKKTKLQKNKLVASGPMPSIYARCFDSSNPLYRGDRLLNSAYIAAQERYLNDELILNGYLFLNRVYDRLGFPATPEGQLVGWVLRSPEQMEEEKRDGHVSFGLDKWPASREFMRGENDAIWLDFNVDGIIYDLIGR